MRRFDDIDLAVIISFCIIFEGKKVIVHVFLAEIVAKATFVALIVHARAAMQNQIATNRFMLM